MKIFNVGNNRKVGRNKFDLSHERKMSMSMGKLIPSFIQEVVPGDQFRVSSEIFMRLAPMIAPVMHRVNVYTHFFFVPNRLLWNEWEDFITGGADGLQAPVMPFIQINDSNKELFYQGQLSDYLGFPSIQDEPTLTEGYDISALPFRAYQMIYNEYYRDQNVSSLVDFSLDSGEVSDGPEVLRLLALRNRAWEKDYFTSALPWSQRGAEVLMPMELSIDYAEVSEVFTQSGGIPQNGTLSNAGGNLQVDGAMPDYSRIENLEQIDNATSSINDLRKALKIQEWLEKAARGGSRYIEQILSHFGVRSSDSRLQRPEYLGGGSQPIVISEVLNSVGSQTDVDFTPLGSMAGHGSSYGSSGGFSRFFEEHGFIIGIMSVIPKTAYQQGLPKYFFRADKFDYYWPEFANLGEQEIKMKELYLNTVVPTANETTFGYQSRYAEYKYAPSTVHGRMRSNLEFWHMGRIFETTPALNEEFVQANPTKRIFAVEDEEEHELFVQLYNKVDAIRPMPFYGNPSLL